MKKQNFLLLDCEAAAEFCEKAEYHEAGFFGKLRLQLHLLFCKSCRKYQAKTKKLSLLLKKADLNPCTKEEKEAFRLRLEKDRLHQESQNP